ncbi:MAG TPA: hypothetical protein VGM43_00750 [Bryobacteraceae bacterium]|jgi:uncharacterized protein (TIGR03437 family)
MKLRALAGYGLLLTLLAGASIAQMNPAAQRIADSESLRRFLESGDMAGVRERARLLRELIASDPAQSIVVTIPFQTRAELIQAFPSAATLLEERGTWTGTITQYIEDDFAGHRARSSYRFRAGREEIEVFFATAPPAGLNCERRVRLSGVRLAGRIAAASFTLLSPGDSCATTGEQKTLAILVSFPSHQLPASVTPDYVQRSLFDSSGISVNTFWRQASYGKTTAVGQVFGPVVLNNDYTCDSMISNQFTNDVLTALGAAADATRFQRIFFVIPDLTCGFGGRGSVGCQSQLSPAGDVFQASISWTVGYDPSIYSVTSLADIASHEGGHNLGLGHASTLDFGQTALGPPSASGVWKEYGDLWDVMGSGFGEYDAPHKALLGWFDSDGATDVQADAALTLLPYEGKSPGPKAIRVRRGTSDKWVWFEYRQPSGLFDSRLDPASAVFQGAIAHYEDPTDLSHFGYSALLTFHPVAAPNNFANAPLLPDEVWVDDYSNLAVKAARRQTGSLDLIVSYRGALLVNPVSLPVVWRQGDAAPPNQTLTTRSTGDPILYTVTTSQQPWLSVAVNQGSTGDAIPLSFAPGNLSPGVYSASVTLTAPDVLNAPVTISVSLKVLPQAGAPLPQSVTPFTGAGSSSLFTLVSQDPATSAAIKYASIAISGTTFSASNACVVRFDTSAHIFQLLGDDGITWSRSLTAGAVDVVENSSCLLNGAASAAYGYGRDFTIIAALSFKSAFGGTHKVYGRAQSALYDSGWQPFGSWTATNESAAFAAKPDNGSGSHQVFQLLFNTPGNQADTWWLSAQFSLNESIVSGCAFYAFAPYQTLGLWDDAGHNVSFAPLGTTRILSNSTCSINAATSGARIYGQAVILTIDVTFLDKGAGRLLTLFQNGSAGNGIPLTRTGLWKTGDPVMPAINAGGVIGAGQSVAPVTSITPGGIVSIYGTSFLLFTASHAVGSTDVIAGTLPSNIVGICVDIGGYRAPLYYVSAGQINAQVPFELATGSSAVTVISSCDSESPALTAPAPISVKATAPEFLSFGSTAGQKSIVAAVNANSGALIGPPDATTLKLQAARTGDILTLYGIGFGQTEPAVLTGQLAVSAATLKDPVRLTIAGVTLSDADILYAGITPTAAGLYQVNIRVPSGLPVGSQPIVIEVGGIASPADAVIEIGN